MSLPRQLEAGSDSGAGQEDRVHRLFGVQPAEVSEGRCISPSVKFCLTAVRESLCQLARDYLRGGAMFRPQSFVALGLVSAFACSVAQDQKKPAQDEKPASSLKVGD